MKTICELVDDHVAEYAVRRCYALGIKARRVRLRSFAGWLEQAQGVRMPNQLQTEHIEKWLIMFSARRSAHTGLPIKTKTIQTIANTVSIFCRWLGAKGESVRGLSEPLDGMRKVQLLPRATPAHAQIRRLLQAMPQSTVTEQMSRTIAEVLYSSGMRPCELLAMNVGDVDFDQGVAKVLGKGQRERMVFLGKIALRSLETYMVGVRPLRLRSPDETALWLNCNGERLHYHTMRALLVDNLPKVDGKLMTAYVFRRAYATELIRSGASPWMVKEGLGHTCYQPQ